MTSVEITDVTLRDGIQMQSHQISTAEKLRLLELLEGCGYSRLEVTSFVSPKWVPQFGDAGVFCKKAFASRKSGGAEWMAFVPNERGLESFLDFPLEWVALFVSVSNTFNKKNVNRSRAETLAAIKPLIERSHKENRRVRLYVSTVFGCPYEGPIEPENLRETLKVAAEMGPDEIALGDTIGVAVPSQVKAVLADLKAVYPVEKTALHLHNTYGLALASAQAGWEAGVRKFDGSTGGIGGCPYAKGASGNSAAEELVYHFYRQKLAEAFPQKAIEAVFRYLNKDLGLPLYSHLFNILEKGGSLYVEP